MAQGKISYNIISQVKSFGMKPTYRINKVLFFLGLSLPLLALVVMGWLAHQNDRAIQGFILLGNPHV